jgi:hypothetical protein
MDTVGMFGLLLAAGSKPNGAIAISDCCRLSLDEFEGSSSFENFKSECETRFFGGQVGNVVAETLFFAGFSADFPGHGGPV